MTKRLFDEDVYMTTCHANIIERTDQAVILDQTIFFPTGGGQYADKGTINGVEVIDVKEKAGVIYHYVKEMITEDQVELSIDWEKRFDEMQQHCGEHILSGVIKLLYDGNNKGFHIGKDYVTIDMDIKITGDMLVEIEDKANEAIYKNIELDFTYADDLSGVDLPVRKDVTVDENIRIVTIPEIDCVACCGTHPHRTGEVGIIKLYKVEKNKGMHRIFFKCGKRALRDLRRKTDIIKVFNQEFSSDDESLLDRYYADKAKSEDLKKAYIALNRKQIDLNIEDQLDTEKSYQRMVFDVLSGQDMNYVIKQVSDKMNTVILIYSKSEKKVMLSHDGTKDVKCNEIFKKIRDFGGKGGGSMKVAQGVFEDNDAGMIFVKYVEEALS
ncbi:alanyl-tRNA editing protein [Acidaminobacter sp. JC074]|uniref:alanyl-tRNA editing protein n=1 Tax=Acidaminobacter sp. JC074 TaxID=2530199 RepID=UPI001F0CFFFE|nr:alanyl-tRNA editing protein [Acidaminobacter sp. JC074]